MVAFARARELLGNGVFEIDVPTEATLASVRDEIFARAAELGADPSVKFAVNGRIAQENGPLNDGDEIAVLPAVGGG